jgi:glycine cleavage system aminomethyltransferase T
MPSGEMALTISVIELAAGRMYSSLMAAGSASKVVMFMLSLITTLRLRKGSYASLVDTASEFPIYCALLKTNFNFISFSGVSVSSVRRKPPARLRRRL